MEKIIKIIFGLFLLCTVNAKAQNDTLTPYEQARYDLANIALNKLGETLSEYDQMSFALSLVKAMDSADDIFDEIAIVENTIIKACDLGDIFKIESAYMSSSLDLHIAYSGDVLQQWSVIGSWYRSEREQIEKTKTSLDMQRESERILAKTGWGRLMHQIAKEFEKWAVKGAYEKTAEYQKRMNDFATSVFDSLCFFKCNEAWLKGAKVSLKGYDADTEYMMVSLSYENDSGEACHELVGGCSVPLEVVQKHEFNVDFYLSYATDIICTDNQIYPQAAYLRDFYGGRVVEFTNTSPFIIAADSIKDLSVESAKYLKGHSFVYASYANKIVPGPDIMESISRIKERYCLLFKNWNNYFEYGGLQDYYDYVPDRIYSKLVTTDECEAMKTGFYKALAEFLNDRSHGKDILENISLERDYAQFVEAQDLKTARKLLNDYVLKKAAEMTKAELRDYESLSKSPLFYILLNNDEMAELFVNNNKFMKGRLFSYGGSAYSLCRDYFYKLRSRQ